MISTLLTQAARQKPGVLPFVLCRKKSAGAFHNCTYFIQKQPGIFLVCINPCFPECWKNRTFIQCSLSCGMLAAPTSKAHSLDYFQGYILAFTEVFSFTSGREVSYHEHKVHLASYSQPLTTAQASPAFAVCCYGIAPCTWCMQDPKQENLWQCAAAIDKHPSGAQAQSVLHCGPKGKGSLLLTQLAVEMQVTEHCSLQRDEKCTIYCGC